jgi:hypothetical protein
MANWGEADSSRGVRFIAPLKLLRVGDPRRTKVNSLASGQSLDLTVLSTKLVTDGSWV